MPRTSRTRRSPRSHGLGRACIFLAPLLACASPLLAQTGPGGLVGSTPRTLSGHKQAVSSLVFSADGKTLISASLDDTIKVWDVATGKEKSSLPARSGGVSVLKLSPDGKTAATGSEDGRVRIWDTSNWTLQKTLTKHGGWVRDVAFNRDGTLLVSGSMDKQQFGQKPASLVLWKLESGEALASESFTQFVYSVAFSPDGTSLLAGCGYETTSGSEPGKLLRREIPKDLSQPVTLKPLPELPGHGGAVNALAFSPDGKVMVSGSADNLLRFWNVTTWKETPMAGRPGHSNAVVCMAISADGRFLASGTYHKSPTLSLWDLKTGKELASVTAHQWGVRALAFSPDGKYLASGAEQAGATIDGSIEIWEVAKLIGK